MDYNNIDNNVKHMTPEAQDLASRKRYFVRADGGAI